MRRLLGRLLADRRVVGGFFLVVQLVAVMYGLDWISERWQWVPYVLNVLSFSIVIWLVRKYDNPNYKIAWIIIILLLPLFGGLFYLLWGNTPFNRARTQHKYEPKAPEFTDYMRIPATAELEKQHPRHAARALYRLAQRHARLDQYRGALLPRGRGDVRLHVRRAAAGEEIHLF